MIADAMVAVADALRAAERVLLACHINPDGDTMGSALALGLALRAAGKDVAIVCPDEPPRAYRFMPGSETFLRAVPSGTFDVSVALDCDGFHRLGPAGPGVRSAARVIEIDHHSGEDRFGDVLVVDRKAAATGDLVFTLLKLLGQPLTPDIATNLYVALLTDTGSFRFANTTARSLRIAAELVDCGADAARIAEHVYETRSFAAVAMLGRALASLKRGEKGALVWARLTARDFLGTGGSDAETEGIINHLRSIEGVKVALLFRQVDGRIRVSLRGRAPVNVAAVARAFGGGGHHQAAGCTLDLPMAQAERAVLAETRKALKRPRTAG
ncbi:MAG: DHH family phosphoesterase [Armatimonadetes bacterium]|nr:DHH family phosphoesterase [Armatimonadota bacterium]